VRTKVEYELKPYWTKDKNIKPLFKGEVVMGPIRKET